MKLKVRRLDESRSKVAPKSKSPGRAKQGKRLSRSKIEIGVPDWFRRRTFHVLNLD